MQVQVPDGLTEGQEFTFMAPNGGQMQAEVPAGVKGGQMIMVPIVIQGVAVASQETPLVPSSAGAGKWRTGLCGCFDDCMICCSVCCCHPITVGQLYERTVQKALMKRLPLFSCLSIAIFLWLLDVVQQLISNSSGTNAFDQLARSANETYYGEVGAPITDTSTSAATYIGELLGFVSMLFVCLIVCMVRGAIRRREGIKPECCRELPLCEDCCCAWCCNPCTQCMIMRHEKLGCVGHNTYSICSHTAFPV